MAKTVLKEADIIPGYRGSTITTSAGKSFINTVIAKLPFSYQIVDNITALNPKYEVFSDLSSDRDLRVNQQSVFKTDFENEVGLGSLLVDKNFQKFMYANLDLDKVKRLQDYRKMSGYSTLADCLDEICDEVFVEDKDEKIVNLKIKGDYSKTIEDEIQKEWDRFIDIFEFMDKGWQYVRQLLIDGELFFENVISDEKPEYGILGAVSIPCELINPFYKNAQNDIIEGFALRKPVINKRTEKMDKEELIIFQKNQVTYIHSGMWNEDRTIRLPYIENARRAYKQLSLIEDSIVIYRLVRAPERLAFHVDVGNMSPPKAEAYIKRLMQQYWAKKTYDTTTGRITNVYDPQSMLDSYWFPKRQGTEGTRVERLEGGHNLGQLDDLLYFLRQLYKSMKVPVGRINPEDVYKDGTEMTREELRFAKFLIRLQKQMAAGLKETFITHLKLRKIWQNYKLKERHLKVLFNMPTMFMMMKQQQMFDLKYNNFNNLSNNEGISNSFAQKMYLELSDEEMAVNREWRRKDAALQYELEQILSNGPGWKEQIQAMNAATAEMGAGGGGMPAGGAEGTETPPEFGPAPAGAEEQQPEGLPTQTPAATQAPATQSTAAPAVGTKPAGKT
jgi:hypothetical protein